MAVKTSDLFINSDILVRDLTYTSSYQNAIYFRGKTYAEAIVSIGISGDDLKIVTKNSVTDTNYTITMKDYFKQNGKNSFKYIKTDEVGEKGHLIDIIGSGLLTNPTNITEPQKGTTVTGTVFSDTINVSSFEVPLTGKGLTINANQGNDKITGTTGIDIINGGAGNDTIYATQGNDTIVGGAGTNTVIYDKLAENFGTDTIKLTKGENLIIDISSYGFTGASELQGNVYANKGNIEINLGNGKVDIAGFLSSNATGISNGVMAYLGKDIEGHDILVNLNSDDIFYAGNDKFSDKGVFNGTRFSETISATNIGKGVTISGGAGINTINVTETNEAEYVDKITGGNDRNIITVEKNGTKTITTGKGNDTINVTGNGVHNINAGLGDNLVTVTGIGKTTITGGKGIDTITVNNNSAQTTINAGAGNNIINVLGTTDSSVVTINTGADNDTIKVTGSGIAKINAGAGIDTVIGGDGNDVINTGNDDDEITGGKGNDTLTGGKGQDTFNFSSGDGKDIITDATSDDIINFTNIRESNISFLKNGNNLIVKYGESDEITIKNYFNVKNKIFALFALNDEDILTRYNLADLIEAKKYTITGKGTINGTNIGEIIRGDAVANSTINALGGNDVIYAGAGKDRINAGAGDDTIYASAGNDVITGGTGANVIKYNSVEFGEDFGDDTINLTKGEELTLDFSDSGLTAGDFSYSFTGSGNKDLLITTTKGTVRLNNFAKTDVTNNATTKAPIDTSYVKLILPDLTEVDLRTKVYDVIIGANYTGNWHNEKIDASGYVAKDKKGEEILTNTKGLTINAGLGNDTITGSKYNDNITGGLGANTIKYNKVNFGNDTINLTKGEQLTLDFSSWGLSDDSSLKYEFAGSGNKDLLITLEGYGSIRLNNFGKTDVTNNATKKAPIDTSYVKLKISESLTIDLRTKEYQIIANANYTGNWHNENINASSYVAKDKKGEEILNNTKGLALNTGTGENTVIGTKYNDTITFGLGDNTLKCQGEFGVDTLKMTKNGNLTIDISSYGYTTEDEVKSLAVLTSKNLEIRIPSKGTVVIPNYVTSDVMGTGKIKIKWSDTQELWLDADILSRSVDERDFVNGVYNGTKFDETIDATFVGRNATIRAYDGKNVIIGTDGYNDTITGGKDGNIITAGDGNKNITTGAGDDTITINGDGTHTINVGGGDNVVELTGSGKTTVTAGAGDDEITVKNNTKTTSINAGNGENTVKLVNTSANGSITTGNGDDDISINSNGAMNYNITSGAGADSIVLTGEYVTSTIKSGDGNDEILTGNGSDFIYCGKGDDIINAGLGDNSFYFYNGDGNDKIEYTSNDITDKLIFPDVTTFAAKFAEGNIILYYGTNFANSVTMKENGNIKHIQVGKGNEMAFWDYIKTLSLGDGVNKSIAGGSSRVIVVKNGMTGESLSYNIQNTADPETVGEFAFNYLQNGRLYIKGDNLRITAYNGQDDDIILDGNNNYIDTGDGNDIVRVGLVVDGSMGTISNDNTVLTGTGDDHVAVYGYDNTINLGAGTNSIYSIMELSDNNITGNEPKLTYINGENIGGTLDGNSGLFSQGSAGGDCRLLSLLDNLSRSSAVTSLRDFVSIVDKGGSYSVTFKNYSGAGKTSTVATNSIEVSGEELNAWTNVYGDLDAVLIDIAMNKLLKVNRDMEMNEVKNAYYNTIGDYLFGQAKITYVTNNVVNAIKTLWQKYQNGEINNLCVGLSGTNQEAIGLVTGHQYSVLDVHDNYITLINPWNTGDKLNIRYSDLGGTTMIALVYGEDIYGEEQQILPNGGSPKADYISSGDVDSIMYQVADWTASTSTGIADVLTSSTDSSAQTIAVSNTTGIQYDETTGQFV